MESQCGKSCDDNLICGGGGYGKPRHQQNKILRDLVRLVSSENNISPGWSRKYWSDQYSRGYINYNSTIPFNKDI